MREKIHICKVQPVITMPVYYIDVTQLLREGTKYLHICFINLLKLSLNIFSQLINYSLFNLTYVSKYLISHFKTQENYGKKMKECMKYTAIRNVQDVIRF